MNTEPVERIKQLVDELRAVIQASHDPFGAQFYAKMLLEGHKAPPPLTPEQLKAVYAMKTPADDPSYWDNFNPADYTITSDEFMAMLLKDEQAEEEGHP